MKYKIRVTQNLTGFYEGSLEIEANSQAEADAQLKKLTDQEIDEMVDWSHGDEYDGDGDIEQHGKLELED